MLGIDVSNNNGAIDWDRVAADSVRFAWVKASEGRSFEDKYLLRNLAGARENGIAVGAYHYARPDFNSPEAEADHFLSLYRPQPGDLLPCLDFEVRSGLSQSAMSRWAKRWMELVEAGLHTETVIYTYPYFLRDEMGGGDELKGRKLWYADYTGKPGVFRYASFASNFDLVAQQYTSSGRVGGVNGRVDMNYAKSLGPILQSKPKPKPKPKKKTLPGPSPKPAWFWKAVKKFIENRKKKV